MSDFSSAQKIYMDDLFDKLKVTFNDRVTDIKNELREQIEELQIEIRTEVKKNEDRILKLEDENKHLQDTVIQLQRKIRKNNLVIHGIEKTEQNLRTHIIKVFTELLEVEITDTEIRDVYRIGSKGNDKQPVVVEFNSFDKKLLIQKNCKKLKGKAISISQDQCLEDRTANKILVKYLKEARSKGISAFIKGNRLVIGNDSYTVEDLESTEKLTDKTEKKKSDSAPATPNTENRNKRLFQEIEIHEQDLTQEQKKVKSSDKTNLKIGKAGGSRIVTRAVSTTSQPK